MLLIFSASSDAGSSGHTSRIIGPLLRWLIPGISELAVRRAVFAVRKAAHLTEYAILALLFWRAWRNRASVAWESRSAAGSGSVEGAAEGAKRPASSRPWRWSEALAALGAVALYAISDEVHQCFVPTREARFADVLLDTAGAALGLLALWVLGRWRHRW